MRVVEHHVGQRQRLGGGHDQGVGPGTAAQRPPGAQHLQGDGEEVRAGIRQQGVDAEARDHRRQTNDTGHAQGEQQEAAGHAEGAARAPPGGAQGERQDQPQQGQGDAGAGAGEEEADQEEAGHRAIAQGALAGAGRVRAVARGRVQGEQDRQR